MDISGIIQKSSTNNNGAPAEMFAGSKLASTQPVRKSDIINEEVQIPQVEGADLNRSEEKRLNHIKKTVERQVQTNVFAVRDNRFTIFKDAKSGQFITRFTSLRDGSVTYVPEPEILRMSGGKSYYELTV